MFCSSCGKKETERGRGGSKRTVDPITKVCNICLPNQGNTSTGDGGAIRRNDISVDQTSPVPDPTDAIPADILNKPGGELSATDIYRIVTSALSGTNNRIDQMDKNIQSKIGVLETRVKILETEGDKKDEEIERLRHTVVNIQKALNSIDQGKRSNNAIIAGLSEDMIEVTTEDNDTVELAGDIAKIKYIAKIMGNEMTDNDLQNITIARIGTLRDGMNRMTKLTFINQEKRDAFVKNSKQLKEAPEQFKKVYVKKDQHPVYIAENYRLRRKMNELRKVEGNDQKTITIKDGKLTIDGSVVDSNLFFH